MHLYLVHHGVAVSPEIDPRRPLSTSGRQHVEALAREAAARGVKPAVVWHSGKLRARQTAEVFWRECHALAELSATKDLQPDDPPVWMRDRLRFESRDILIAGHFPHLPGLLALLVGPLGQVPREFPPHGVVALETLNQGESWKEMWRLR